MSEQNHPDAQQPAPAENADVDAAASASEAAAPPLANARRLRWPLAWVLLGPLLWLAADALLKLQAQDTLAQWQKIGPATVVGSAGEAIWQASWPFLLAVAALTLAGLALRLAIGRLGWLRVAPLMLGLWVALWALGAVALAAQHFNRSGHGEETLLNVKLLLARPVKASARASGGFLAHVQPANDAAAPPLSVRLLSEQPVTLATNDALLLIVAHGRWWGRYVTAWHPLCATGGAADAAQTPGSGPPTAAPAP
ncbi:MAG: hypothetical protein LBP52_07005 [Burkholderiaceae bacterium]|jgi:hypothetical protein|nr:hypothetical protein [Burkholderiaceae bacterium]